MDENEWMGPREKAAYDEFVVHAADCPMCKDKPTTLAALDKHMQSCETCLGASHKKKQLGYCPIGNDLNKQWVSIVGCDIGNGLEDLVLDLGIDGK